MVSRAVRLPMYSHPTEKDVSVRRLTAALDSRAVGGRYREVVRLAALALCVLGLCLVSTGDAQVGGGKKKPGAAAKQKGKTKAKSSARKAKKSPSAPDEKADEADSDSDDALKLPSAKLPEMEIKKPLISKSELKPLLAGPTRLKQLKALWSGEMSTENRRLIDDWARASIYQMTLPENFRELHEIRKRLSNELRGAGRSAPNDSAKRNFREFVCRTVLDKCVGDVVVDGENRGSVLFDNNYHARLNAIIIISYLDVVEGSLKELPVPYAGSADPLLKVVTDENQHVSLKIAAVNGLRRLALGAELSSPKELEIAQTLVAELKKDDTHPWYQERLARALGAVDVQTGFGGHPLIVDVLSRVMVDPERHWVVRGQAARSLGRCPMPASVDVGLLAYEIARTTHEMGTAYNAAKPASRREYFWPNCFFNAYLAFQRRDKYEPIAYQPRKIGLLTTHPSLKVVQSAYEQICPTVSFVLRQFPVDKPPTGAKVPDSHLANLGDWLKSNEPSAKAIAPGLDPLRDGIKVAGPNGKKKGKTVRK